MISRALIAVAVVEWEGQVLVGPRPAGVPLAGLWEFPGGKAQPGETPAHAAVRECLEETGLAVVVVSEYPAHAHTYEHGQVDLRFFACRPLASDLAPRAPFRWVERRALAQLEFPAGNQSLLALLGLAE